MEYPFKFDRCRLLKNNLKLIPEPEILLCDEPTSSLDSKAVRIIKELLVLLKESCTLLVVSHDLDQVGRIGDRVMTLENGVLIRLRE